MLLQKALRELDAEIDRWLRVREVVAGLKSSSWPSDRSLPALQTIEQNNTATAPQEILTAARGKAATTSEAVTDGAQPAMARRVEWRPRQARTHRTIAPVARALGGSIPVRPVVVAPGSAVRVRAAEHASSKPAVIPAQEGTLDALLRELSNRPLLGT